MRGAASFALDLEKQLTLMADRAPSCRRVLEVARALVSSEAGAPLLGQFENAWHARTFSAFYERPLLLLAALRNDVLLEGATHPLFAALGADRPSADAATTEALLESLAPSRLACWMSIRARRVQTNEPRRGVTWLWPAAVAGASRGGRKIALVDVGASAGLNLVADQMTTSWRAHDGLPIRCARNVDTVARLGFDTRPLDVRKPDDRRWLEACVWPGERDRLEMQRRAVAAFVAMKPLPELSILTASAVPHRLAQLHTSLGPDVLVIAYQTLMVGYLVEQERKAYLEGMQAWLANAPPERAMWVTLEIGDSSDAERGCMLEARVSRGGHATHMALARTGYHPETLHIDRQAESELEFLVGQLPPSGRFKPSSR